MLTAVLVATVALASPITPGRDDQVIESLPPLARTTPSTDPAVAAREARALLDASRQAGDPRLAGRALARLARWNTSPSMQAPADVVLVLAETEQYLHQFGPAAARLQALIRRDPGQAQAWLLLATLHRVQGRYAASDEACTALQGLRAQPYADACAAENQALRGEHDAARQRLLSLLARHRDPGTRAWLLTTVAELEQRAGRIDASDTAWRQALQAEPGHYAQVGYADFLLDQRRDQAAWNLLRDLPASDGILLRQAIAARRLGLPEAAALRHALTARQAQADLRPEDSGHQRERALMALDVEARPAAALAHARKNIAAQREPIDLWLLARCAQAAGDPQALADARRQAAQQGLQDARIDAL